MMRQKGVLRAGRWLLLACLALLLGGASSRQKAVAGGGLRRGRRAAAIRGLASREKQQPESAQPTLLGSTGDNGVLDQGLKKKNDLPAKGRKEQGEGRSGASRRRLQAEGEAKPQADEAAAPQVDAKVRRVYACLLMCCLPPSGSLHGAGPCSC
jgi:hypothetical protein